MSAANDVASRLPEVFTAIAGYRKSWRDRWRNKDAYGDVKDALLAMGDGAADLLTPYLTPYETAAPNRDQVLGALVVVGG